MTLMNIVQAAAAIMKLPVGTPWPRIALIKLTNVNHMAKNRLTIAMIVFVSIIFSL